MHADIIDEKLSQPSHPVRFSFLAELTSHDMTVLQLRSVSNMQPFGYKSYALTNCTIIARQMLR